jgi:hypothetical protein
VLAIVDLEQPFGAEEFAAVERYVSRGGRLLVAASTRDSVLGSPHGTSSLLAEYGIETLSGFAAAPIRDARGADVVGDRRCAYLVLGSESMDAKSPVTESLWRARRRVVAPGSRAFARGAQVPKDAVWQEILRAPRNAWIDRPGANGLYAWIYDPDTEEAGPAPLCVAVTFKPPGVQDDSQERRAARILALGSPDVLSDSSFDENSDFALNAFNWLAERDWRLSISPRSQETRRLDLRNSDSSKWVTRVSLICLPGVCAVLGIALFLRRRS